MTWARLDDQFHSHPKVAEMDPDSMLAAVGLHTLVLSWCANQLTDGHVPVAQVRRLAGQPVDNLIGELIRVGLWERSKSGYLIHDYLDYNPSKAQVVAERKRKSEGGRRGGIASGRTRREGYAEGYAEGDALAGASPMLRDPFAKRSGGSGTPVPIPIPYSPKEEGDTSRAREAAPLVENAPNDFEDIDFGEGPGDKATPLTDNRTEGQRLVALYVDERTKAGSKPTSRQIGILAQVVGDKLEGGSTPESLGEAVHRMVRKGKGPSTLPAFVDEVEAGPKARAPSRPFVPPRGPDPDEPEVPMPEFLKGTIGGVGRAMP